MFHHVPDPTPGRCVNHRMSKGSPYDVVWKRCILREGHRTACEFPPDPPPTSGIAYSLNQWRPDDPKPWTDADIERERRRSEVAASPSDQVK